MPTSQKTKKKLLLKANNRMRKILGIILIISTLTACNMRPLGVVSEEKLADVLYDIYLTDAVLNVRLPNRETSKDKYYNLIYEKHHISKKNFDKSIKWYAAHPKKFEIVYNSIKSRIEYLKVDVENYKFHPQEKITGDKNSLDTIELYTFENQYVFENLVPKDSLRFEIAGYEHFAVGDRFILDFLLNIEGLDTAKMTNNTNAILTITYSNGSTKHLRHKLKVDGKTYHYRFQPSKNDSIAPIKVECNIFAGNDMFKKFNLSSIKLLRIYNFKKYPYLKSLPETRNISPKIL
jgi:hypothetical protein